MKILPVFFSLDRVLPKYILTQRIRVVLFFILIIVAGFSFWKYYNDNHIHNHTLSDLFSNAYADYPTYNPPNAHYNFDQGSGSALTDNAGNGHQGTWQGTQNNLYTTGKYGSAGNFDGTSQYVSLSTSNVLNATSGTISMWVKINGDQTQTAFAFASVNNSNPDTSRLYFEFYNGGSTIGCVLGTATFNGTYTLTTGEWTHIACTWDGTKSAFYVNGIDKTTNATFSGLSNLASSATIGSLNTQGYFAGNIDEVRLYNYAETQQQVQQDMRTSAVSYYSFDDTTGSTVLDQSNNGHLGTWHGTLSNLYVRGKYGNAGSFDGTSKYVSASPANSINNASGTISMWINPDTQNNQTASTFAFTSVNGSSPNTSRVYFQFTAGAGNRMNCVLGNTPIGSVVLPAGQWHYVTCEWDGTSASLYVDGINKAIGTFAGLSTQPNSISIGSLNTQGYFKGTIDELRIYQYAQTSDQIQQDMQSYATLFPNLLGVNLAVACRKSNSPISYVNTSIDIAYSDTLPSAYGDTNVFSQCKGQWLAAIDFLASQGVKTVRLWPLLSNFAYDEVATTSADTPPAGYTLVTQGPPAFQQTRYYWVRYTDLNSNIDNFDTILNRLKQYNMKAYLTLAAGGVRCSPLPVPPTDVFDQVFDRRSIPVEMIKGTTSTLQDQFINAEQQFIDRYKDDDTIVGYNLVNEAFILFESPSEFYQYHTTDTPTMSRPGNECGMNYTDLTDAEDNVSTASAYFKQHLTKLEGFFTRMYTTAKQTDGKHFFTFDDPVRYHASNSDIFQFFEPMLDVYDIHSYQNIPPSSFFTTYPYLFYQPYGGKKPLILGEATSQITYGQDIINLHGCDSDGNGDIPEDSLCQSENLAMANGWVQAAKANNLETVFLFQFGGANTFGYHTFSTEPTQLPTPSIVTPCMNPTSMPSPTPTFTPTSGPSPTKAPPPTSGPTLTPTPSPTVPSLPTTGPTWTPFPTIPAPTYAWYPAGQFASDWDNVVTDVPAAPGTVIIPLQLSSSNWNITNSEQFYNFYVTIVDSSCKPVFNVINKYTRIDAPNHFTLIITADPILTTPDTYTITVSPSSKNSHGMIEKAGESFTYTPGQSQTLPALQF